MSIKPEWTYTVRVSDEAHLSLPKPLFQALRLSEGEMVEVTALGQTIHLRRIPVEATKELSTLTRIIKSSLPVGTVDMSQYMTKYGYEQLCEDASDEAKDL